MIAVPTISSTSCNGQDTEGATRCNSLLEGTASPAALLARARACGYTALALTDTNNLYGAVPFVEQESNDALRELSLGFHRWPRRAARCL